MPAYYPGEMLDAMEREAVAARARTADWMARQTMINMLHLDPDAADGHGGKPSLLGKLRRGYDKSLTGN